MFTIENEPLAAREGRKKILESFDKLVFDEGPHIYTLGEQQLISVTTLAEKYKEQFDVQLQSEKYAKKHGETAEYWRNKWKYTNLCSTTMGTLTHEYGESSAYVRNNHPELITDSCKMKYNKEHNWLIPTRLQENACSDFWDSIPNSLHFVLAEAKIFNLIKNPYAGTFDLLMYYEDEKDESKSGFVIMDYKTNKSLISDYNRQNGVKLLSPFDDMIDEPKSIYTIQLSLYQMALEKIGIKVIARRLIYLQRDGTFQKIALPSIVDKLKEIFD